MNTNGTSLVNPGTQVLHSGVLFNKHTDSSKKDSGQSCSLFNIPSNYNHPSNGCSPYNAGAQSGQKPVNIVTTFAENPNGS